MGHEFAQHKEAEVPASPDEIWAAIATGPGIDSWFMGRSDVQPVGGRRVRRDRTHDQARHHDLRVGEPQDRVRR